MASAEQELGDELVTCTICLEHFTSPKTLICLHTFCESCLRRHLMVYQNQRRANMTTIPCPTCREVTALPPTGVTGLRTDFKIAKIVDFLAQIAGKAKLCDICRTIAQDTDAAHYCRDCNKYFCSDCIYRHINTDVFEAHVVRELSSRETTRTVCKDHEKELEALKYFCQSCGVAVCTLCTMTDHMLHNITDLDQGKARHQRTKRLGRMVEKLSTKIDQIDGFLERLLIFKDSLKSSFDETKDKIKNRADEIIRYVKEDEQKLLINLQQQYEGKLENICSERENLQQWRTKLVSLKITTEQLLDTDEESDHAIIQNTPNLLSELKLSSQIQFLNPDDFEKVDATFQLKFPTEMPKVGQLGEHNLSANFSFISRIPIQLVSKVTNAGFDWPSDAAIMSSGDLVVADTENYQLQIIDKLGRPKNCIAVGEIKPAGVAVTAVGTIVVTDILDRCVKIFNEQGELLHEFGNGLFDSPAGVAVNSLGDIIVSDVVNHCVTVHNSQGNMTARLGSYGTQDGDFDGPWYVATNDQNDIIVSDMGNKCIKVFNYQLELVTKVEDPDSVMCPAGVGTDLQGNILVCDSGRNVISMYTPDGNFIDHILTEDDGMDGPHGITLGQSGQFIVTQCGNKTISQHEIRLYQLYE